MLVLDQRTLQVKYRVPATEIYRMSLSPYLDDVAVVHVRAVSIWDKIRYLCELNRKYRNLRIDFFLTNILCSNPAVARRGGHRTPLFHSFIEQTISLTNYTC